MNEEKNSAQRVSQLGILLFSICNAVWGLLNGLFELLYLIGTKATCPFTIENPGTSGGIELG